MAVDEDDEISKPCFRTRKNKRKECKAEDYIINEILQVGIRLRSEKNSNHGTDIIS